MTTIPVLETASAPSRAETTTSTTTASETRRPWTFGRCALVGATLGFVIVTTAVLAFCLAHDVAWQSGLALGAYVGSFGGAGFGAMVGSVLYAVRHEDDD